MASSKAVSKSMKGNVSKDTEPEKSLRRALWGAGFKGYRVNYRDAPGAPDIAFTRRKLAIFVNGCFWHRCPHCRKGLPKRHASYWRRKFEDNKVRDSRVVRKLRRNGWHVLVVWECRIERNMAGVVKSVDKSLSRLEKK
jgi:DNA mismatch endonuclease (patch repair protein)